MYNRDPVFGCPGMVVAAAERKVGGNGCREKGLIQSDRRGRLCVVVGSDVNGDGGVCGYGAVSLNHRHRAPEWQKQNA